MKVKVKATGYMLITFLIPGIMLIFVWMNAHWSVALFLTYIALHTHLQTLNWEEERKGQKSHTSQGSK